MKEQLTVRGRYGTRHKIDKINENTWRCYDFSRFSFTDRDENGKYRGVDYIDFDGGPFTRVGYPCPWDESRIVKELILDQEGEIIKSIDIILE